MPKSSTRSALKSSRSSTPSVSKTKNFRFGRLVRTLSPNEEEVPLDEIEEFHQMIPRNKNRYKPTFPWRTQYSSSNRALPQELMEWQTRDEYHNAVGEKRDEAIRNGYKWSVDAVSDDLQTVTVSNLENPEESKTISTTYFDGIPIVGALYKKITGLLFRKGGKRTQKKRRTNKKRKN
jgi:hypothetical protein